MRGLSLVAASGGHSSSRCAGFSLSQPLLLRSTSSRRTGSVIVAHGPSCSAACGIYPGQDSNPCPLHWQADSQPLHHQGSPHTSFLIIPLLGTLRMRWEVGERCAFPLKSGNSERRSVKGEPAGYLGHRHFLRQVHFKADDTQDRRIWNWFPLNDGCRHIPQKGFKVPPGAHPLGSEGRCSKTPAWIDLKFKSRGWQDGDDKEAQDRD